MLSSKHRRNGSSNICFRIIAGFIIVASSFFSNSAFAERLVIEIEIINHFFVPDRIEIPADTKVKLIIHNRDEASEEFESYELNREKLIMGGKKASVFIGPLAKGEYPFFGEFSEKTAQGIIVVK